MPHCETKSVQFAACHELSWKKKVDKSNIIYTSIIDCLGDVLFIERHKYSIHV